jgi:hypothetical protein
VEPDNQLPNGKRCARIRGDREGGRVNRTNANEKEIKRQDHRTNQENKKNMKATTHTN